MSCTVAGKKIWVDYLSEKVLHLVASIDIVALSTLNAKVLVYTPNGRRYVQSLYAQLKTYHLAGYHLI